MPMRSVDAHTPLPSYYAEHSAVLHRFQQMRRRVRRTAPIVSDCAVREIIIYFPRMHCTAFLYKLQQKTGLLLARGVPSARAFRRHTSVRTWMHQRLYASRKKTVD